MIGQLFLISLACSLIIMVVAFVLAKLSKSRYDLVDVFWPISFMAIALFGAYISGLQRSQSWQPKLVVILVLVWGVRLALHLLRRWRRSQSIDKRYEQLISNWPAKHVSAQALIRIFATQAVLSAIICLPVMLSINKQQHNFWNIAGLIIWLVGFTFESIGDWQLAQFIKNPANRGKLMTAGLWSVTRHPNYFGEILLWWGIGLMSLGSRFGWLGLIGPSLLSYLIIKVSGVPLAEAAVNTKPGWKQYAAKTPVLIPRLWP